MPARITAEKAEARLEQLMPEWETVFIDDRENWVRRWCEASGDARATGFRMRDLAYEVSIGRSDAILHLYRGGYITKEAAEVLLTKYMRPDLRARGFTARVAA